MIGMGILPPPAPGAACDDVDVRILWWCHYHFVTTVDIQTTSLCAVGRQLFTFCIAMSTVVQIQFGSSGWHDARCHACIPIYLTDAFLPGMNNTPYTPVLVAGRW